MRGLAEQVAKAAPRLDLLINNAGIGGGGPGAQRQVNAAGVELRFAVNYLAGFALTLQSAAAAAGEARPARIVNVASVGQQAIDFDDVMLERGYSGGRAYMQSKLAQVMFTFDLAARLKGTGVTVNCLHPATYMSDDHGAPGRRERRVSTVEEGGQAILQLAHSPIVEGRSGLYFNGLAEFAAPTPKPTTPRRAAQAVGAEPEQLTGLTGEGI